MSDDDNRNENDTVARPHTRNAPATPSSSRSIFSLPAPLRRIFDQFPLKQYAANELPVRAPRTKTEHVLHVFITDEEAEALRPSYNPGCLKWQVGGAQTAECPRRMQAKWAVYRHIFDSQVFHSLSYRPTTMHLLLGHSLSSNPRPLIHCRSMPQIQSRATS